MSSKAWKVIFYIITVIGIWLLGFYLGRRTIKDTEPKVITEYIKGETIHDSIPYPVPYKVIMPVDTADVIQACINDGIYTELWPEKTVTKYVEVTKADTSAILADWGAKRLYKEQIFDIDTVGTCTIDAEVQYNRLRLLGYDYTPVTKQVTVEKNVVKAFSPYVGASFLINPWDDVRDPSAQLSFGAFIHETYGVQLQYQHGFKSKNDFIGGGLLYKF